MPVAPIVQAAADILGIDPMYVANEGRFVAFVAPEEIAGQLECTAREVRDILRIAQQPVSLEKPIGEEEESELGDFVEDQTAESPFELASENLRRENVRRALAAPWILRLAPKRSAFYASIRPRMASRASATAASIR